MSTSTYKPYELKSGDRIVFDFRGKPNRLGEVEVFDVRPAGHNHTTLVLLDSSGQTHHRRVHDIVKFAVV